MATAMCVLREQWRKRYHLLGFGIGMAGGYTTIGGPVSISAYYAVIGTVSNHAARLCEEARPRQRSPREEAFTRMSAFRILLWRAQRPHAGAKLPYTELALSWVQPCDYRCMIVRISFRTIQLCDSALLRPVERPI